MSDPFDFFEFWEYEVKKKMKVTDPFEDFEWGNVDTDKELDGGNDDWTKSEGDGWF